MMKTLEQTRDQLKRESKDADWHRFVDELYAAILKWTEGMRRK
jgi:hypothetical protein